jgi:hypothetical protein
MNRGMISSFRYALALLVCLMTLGPVTASAANDSPQTAIALTAANSRISTNLTGTPGGAYQYYSVAYQGGSAPALFTLTFQPGYGSTGNGQFGFVLYGPSSLSFPGQLTSNNGNVSTTQYTLANPAAMNILVQVYNYTAGMQVGYTLTVSGLSGGSSAGIVGQNNTTPAQALTVSTINATIGGTIVGNPAGDFQFYNLRYPGGNTNLTITMNASPTYHGQGQAYGFNLYRSNPNGAAPTLAVQGVVQAQDTNSETISATLNAPSGGVYQLQVFNYWPGVSVNFAINSTGLAGSVRAVSGNGDAGHAVVLNSAQPGASETLTGSGAGAFNYYLVSYPGNLSNLALSLTFSDTGGAPDKALGITIYNGSQFVGTVTAVDDGTGVQVANWNYSNASAATFGVQVFNYAPGATASYTLYQVGAQ